jgi:hypothetical protein
MVTRSRLSVTLLAALAILIGVALVAVACGLGGSISSDRRPRSSGDTSRPASLAWPGRTA